MDPPTDLIIAGNRLSYLGGSDHDTAEQHAREAIRLVLTTDLPDEQADVHMDLADVLERAGRHEDSAEMLDTAITLYRSKGDITGLLALRGRVKT